MRVFYMFCAAALACGGDGGTPDAGDAAPTDCACIDIPDTGPNGATSMTVLDSSGTSLVTFDAKASGDVAPTTTIAGDQTNLIAANALAMDAAGNLYVTTPLAILVFSAGASGNVAPARTIAGPSALAATDTFVAIAVLPDGTIFAASELTSGTSRSPKVLVFPPNANGDVAPAQTITGPTTTMQDVLSMSVFFTQIAVADASQKVFFFHPSDNGDVAPVRTLLDAPGIVEAASFDSVSAIFLARYDFTTSSVISFIAGAKGSPTPLANVTGPTTGITAPAGVAVDIAGTVYVTNADPAGASIRVFSSSADGDTAPLRTIAGASTTLTGDVSQFPMPIVVR